MFSSRENPGEVLRDQEEVRSTFFLTPSVQPVVRDVVVVVVVVFVVVVAVVVGDIFLTFSFFERF